MSGNKQYRSEKPKSQELTQFLDVARLQSEKCELRQAGETYAHLLKQAKKLGDFRMIMEALAGLLRLAGEALDEKAIQRWDEELNEFMKAHPRQIPPMVWYCKGAVARYQGELLLAQRHVHRYLWAVRTSRPHGESSAGDELRGWVMLAILLQQRKCLKRSHWLVEELLRRFDTVNGGNDLNPYKGILFLLLGTLHERRKDFKTALRWFQMSHSHFLANHHWYNHLYALYGYARIERQQQNFTQAYFYLNLVDKAASGAEFGLLRREIASERIRLESEAVDLLIDSRRGLVKTRENGEVPLRKQYVLLHILEALTLAHRKPGNDRDRGLSKAEIIKYVWKEPYEASVHDNKLYYNINRLRKLIEPDVRQPQYLLNSQAGYRLAPGLKVQLLGSHDHSIERGNTDEDC